MLQITIESGYIGPTILYVGVIKLSRYCLNSTIISDTTKPHYTILYGILYIPVKYFLMFLCNLYSAETFDYSLLCKLLGVILNFLCLAFLMIRKPLNEKINTPSTLSEIIIIGFQSYDFATCFGVG